MTERLTLLGTYLIEMCVDAARVCDLFPAGEPHGHTALHERFARFCQLWRLQEKQIVRDAELRARLR